MEKTEFSALFQTIFAKNGLNRFCSEEIIDRFWAFTNLFLAENAKTNLSAIRTPQEMIAKHYADCLLAEEFLPQNATLLDVGCGGGFPCIPFAIVRPDLCITALDSTQKKLDFVKKAATELSLSNLQPLCGRAEDLAHRDLREQFDLVTARAVANLPVLAELCLPFAKVGGAFLALKGAKGAEELAFAQKTIEKLGGTLKNNRELPLFCLAGGESASFVSESRRLILISKQSATPSAYPRAYASILKKPL